VRFTSLAFSQQPEHSRIVEEAKGSQLDDLQPDGVIANFLLGASLNELTGISHP
jgi:hypothetical protein